MTEGSAPHAGDTATTACIDDNATAAIAAVQQLAVEPDPSNIVGLAAKRYDKILPPAMLEYAVALLAEAMRTMAALKNVSVTADYAEAMAKATAAALAPELLRNLTDGNADAVAFVARSINALLDTVAATRVLQFMWELEGFHQIDCKSVTRQAGSWINVLLANDAPDQRYRWPDTADMATHYYRARSGGPVLVRCAEGQAARVRCFLDTGACRAPLKPADRTAMAIPLLIHCPGLPGTPEAVMPDGRCVKKCDDGIVCTTYWKNGVLHRDLADGPARIVRDEEAGVTTEEYWTDGEMLETRTVAFEKRAATTGREEPIHE